MSGRPCDVSDILVDLAEAVRPLAQSQQRVIELNELGKSLQVAVEEPALRQALSNLIESALLRTHTGGKVEIVSTGAPAGGVLVVIDDDGADMHYMVIITTLYSAACSFYIQIRDSNFFYSSFLTHRTLLVID